MPRTLHSPEYNVVSRSVVDIARGGTNAETSDAAKHSLRVLGRRSRDIPFGYGSLNSLIQLKEEQIPANLNQFINIKGPLTSAAGAQTTHTITNFDIGTLYLFSTISGTITHTEEVITYTAPSLPGVAGFYINEKPFYVTVTGDGVVQPAITSPYDKATKQYKSVVITSSAFVCNSTITDSHLSSTWQLSDTPTFDVIRQNSTRSTTNKTTWTVVNLTENTTYYVRVLHTGNINGDSLWSGVRSFTTKSGYYPQVETFEIASEALQANDQFGTSVALNGVGTLFAGSAPTANDSFGIPCGVVYTYWLSHGTTWVGSDSLKPSSPAIDQLFGFSISISNDGNTLVIGSPGHNANTGAVYIFTRANNVWTQSVILLANDSSPGDMFGYSVEICGNGATIAVGSINDSNLNGTNSGAVYIFSFSGTAWTQQAKILAISAGDGWAFGTNVALSYDGNTLAASYPKKTINAVVNRGAVSIYTRYQATWTANRDVIDSGGVANDYFGSSLAISSTGNILFVGSGLADTTHGINSGVVRVYTLNGADWVFQAQLLGADTRTGDNFGTSISCNNDGSIVMIGAPSAANVSRRNAGASYIFTQDGNVWSERPKLLANDSTAYSFFGNALKLSADGNMAVICSFRHPFSYIDNAGAAYIFN